MPVNVNLMIVKFSRADPGLIKYIRQGPATVNEFDTQRSTIFGHKNAVGAEAVGAAAYFNTPVIGVSPPAKWIKRSTEMACGPSCAHPMEEAWQ